MVQILRRPRQASLAVALGFASFAYGACGAAPSRAPLGGNYDALAITEAKSRTPKAVASAAPSEAEPEPSARPAPAPDEHDADAEAHPPSKSTTDSVVYQPLQAGDRVQAEVALDFDAELAGAPGGNGKLMMASKLRVELKISKASAQSLDELELSVTTLSMHSEFGGHSSDAKPATTEVFDVTLGQSPSLRAHDGSKPDAEERALLLVLVAPIADFHGHWAHSPTLDLKPGWSSTVPITVPKFADGHTETIAAGPLGVRYAGRDRRDWANDSVPFDLTLPLQYAADLGKLDFELAGKATLSEASGRPTALELSGPFKARAAHEHAGASQLSLSGHAKFSATLSYR